MEFKIRETQFGVYIDLYTDNGILVIGGGNKYNSIQDAENMIEAVKTPITYIKNDWVKMTRQKSYLEDIIPFSIKPGSDWGETMVLSSLRNESCNNDRDSTFKFFRD